MTRRERVLALLLSILGALTLVFAVMLLYAVLERSPVEAVFNLVLSFIFGVAAARVAEEA